MAADPTAPDLPDMPCPAPPIRPLCCRVLHADPVHPSSGGDPKVLVLAALGGWLAQMLVRDRVGTTTEVQSARRRVAQDIYRMAWLLLFGVSAKADQAALGGALKRLLEALVLRAAMDWSAVLLRSARRRHRLRRGRGWDDPADRPVRRPALGDPLSAARTLGRAVRHRAARRLASRFFSKLCCISALAPPAVAADTSPWQRIPIGDGILYVGDLARPMDEVRPLIVSQRKVGTAEMIASVLTLMTQRPSAARPQPAEQPRPSAEQPARRFTALVLGDLVAEGTVMLLVPESS